MNYKKFIWDDSYSVKVKLIDEQHQTFLNIANDIFDLLEQENVDRDKLLFSVTKLGDYAMYHLSTEEEYFQLFHYEEVAIHTQVHNDFRHKIVNDFMIKAKDPSSNIKELAGEAALFVKDWLLNHILVMDKRYTECFNSHGLNGQQKI